MTTSIAPWLSVADATSAVEFYKAALGAVELERVEAEPGLVLIARLAIGGAEFWVQEDADANPARAALATVRMILSVEDPDALFTQAIAAGATEVAAIHEDNGWRIGRIADSAGHHWEIGKRL